MFRYLENSVFEKPLFFQLGSWSLLEAPKDFPVPNTGKKSFFPWLKNAREPWLSFFIVIIISLSSAMRSYWAFTRMKKTTLSRNSCASHLMWTSCGLVCHTKRKSECGPGLTARDTGKYSIYFSIKCISFCSFSVLLLQDCRNVDFTTRDSEIDFLVKF